LTLFGIWVGADVPDQIVISIEQSEARVQFCDHQEFTPLCECTRAAQEIRTNRTEVNPAKVVHLDSLVLAIGNVELWFDAGSPTYEDSMWTNEPSTTLIARQRQLMDPVLVETVDLAGSIPIGYPDIAAPAEPFLVHRCTAWAVLPHHAWR
jgi:hypothetical protein